MHSSIADHIDRDGAKCCNSNLPYPMLMKTFRADYQFTQLCGIVKESGNSFENILKSGLHRGESVFTKVELFSRRFLLGIHC